MGDLIAGVDIGGTFTDLVLYDTSSHAITIEKVPTTPQDYGLGVIQVLGRAVDDFSRIEAMLHGSTIGVNAIIEKKLPRIGMMVTKGFGDELDIQRYWKHWGETYWSSAYDLQQDKPDPIVPRHLRAEIDERVTYPGEVIRPLDEEQVRQETRRLMDAGVTAIAVTYLWTFLNPDHERRTRELIREEGFEGNISLSSEVAPIFHEYERMVTTAINAALASLMLEYLRTLQERLSERGFAGTLNIMQCDGGMIGVDVAINFPVRTLMSGPAAGVMAAHYFSRVENVPNVISFDMGGTSLDVATVIDSELLIKTEEEIAEYPIRLPFVDVHSIGAGGGSIASVDPGGGLQVGPRSAGAVPGPVCYAQGNTEPTVTDANLILNRLDADNFLGGRFQLRRDLAEEALAELGEALGQDAVAVSKSIVDILNTNMMHAVRTITVERGLDPREFQLLAYGGASGLHIAEIAKPLGIHRAVVARRASCFSALGMILSDYKFSTARTILSKLERADLGALEDAFQELEEESLSVLEREGFSRDRIALQRAGDMRYEREEWETRVNLPDTMPNMSQLVDMFRNEHGRVYALERDLSEPVEMVTLHVAAIGHRDDVVMPQVPAGDDNLDRARMADREVFIGDGFASCPVYDWSKLLASDQIDGPAVIADAINTVYVPPDSRVTIDAEGNALIDIEVE